MTAATATLNLNTDPGYEAALQRARERRARRAAYHAAELECLRRAAELEAAREAAEAERRAWLAAHRPAFAELQPGQCRYFVARSELPRADSHVCGFPVEGGEGLGQSYCAEHLEAVRHSPAGFAELVPEEHRKPALARVFIVGLASGTNRAKRIAA